MTGDDGEARATAALAAALDKVRPEAARLSVNLAEKMVRRAIFANLPTTETIQAGTPVKVEVDTRAALEEATASLRRAIDDEDWTSVVTRCPVRASSALDAIARKVGFKGRPDYEKAVRQLLIDDAEALAFGRSLLAEASSEVGAAL